MARRDRKAGAASPGARDSVDVPPGGGERTDPIRFEVLGHLRARAEGRSDSVGSELPLGGHKQRLVLALLLARPTEVVSTERLIDDVWGDDVPSTARHTLQGYVSELRKAVGPVLESVGTGYRVRVDAGTLDALEFESLVSEGAALVDPDSAAATETLRRALELWQGEPYHGLEHNDLLATEVARLTELRLGAVEHLMRTELALGRHRVVTIELERLTIEHPYREELRALQMLALYRSGRQADALRAYQRTARVLADDLGIDPSPVLARLEQQILVQDPTLDLSLETEEAVLARAATAPVENPYMGLHSFREDDRDVFHGRDTLIDQIVGALSGGRTLVTIIGPSGSGKSSVIQAGVIPSLRQRPESGPRVIATMQPGRHPFAELRSALARFDPDQPTTPPRTIDDEGLLSAAASTLGEKGRLVLVIDQFEELYTLVDDVVRGRFLRGVATAVRDERVQVVVALRADFYDRLLRDREFAGLFIQHVVNVLPLDGDDLETAAVLPARRSGLTLEPRLVAALLADVEGQANALPLFQYALTELWEHRDGPTLTLAHYHAFGGLRRSVANRADEIYSGLDTDQQEAARQLFLRLVAVAGDAEGRRRIAASELTELDVDLVALQAAIEVFTRHRLVTLDRDPAGGAPTVEVAHEALLGEWRLLREWLDAARDDLRMHRGFALALDEWIDSGRDDEFLLTGGRLAEYERWAAETTLRLTTTERAFLEAAVSHRRAIEAAERDRVVAETKLRRGARRRTWALVVAVAALVGVVTAGLVVQNANGPPTIGLFAFDRGHGGADDLVIGGLEPALRDVDVDLEVIDRSMSDPEGSLADLAEHSGLVVLGIGTQDVLTPEIVAAYSETTFVLLDHQAGVEPMPGVAWISYRANEGSFLVGAAAALESRTGIVGFVGGHQTPQIEEFRAGFEDGARAVDPDIDVLASFVGSFTDQPRVKATATSMYERGADVVFHVAGRGTGTVEAADEQSSVLGRHLWAIGVDDDQYLAVPAELGEHVLTSMLKRFDRALEETIRAYLGGELVEGNLVFSLADGGVGFARSGDHMAPSTIERLEALEAEIASGLRTVPQDPRGEVDPSPIAADPVGMTVSWDGRACSYVGPAGWQVGDLVHLGLSNRSTTDALIGVQRVSDEQLVAGVEVAAGGHGSARVELGRAELVEIVCRPTPAGRPVVGEQVTGPTIAVAEQRTGTTSALGLPLGYTVPGSWSVQEFPGRLMISPPGWTDWPPLVLLSEMRAAESCFAADPDVRSDAAAIAGWLAEHPGLMGGPPDPVEVGGLTGYSLDLAVVDGWTGTCPIFDSGPAVPTLFRAQIPGRSDWWQIASPGWSHVYYLLDVPDAGTMAIIVEADIDQETWDELLETLEPVLDGLDFDVPDT
jgi:basic membrane lipoprotein Med (substrate-binding protein (PBP1-ABC) superfamily)/DNA-binding SARP family transcriptional activator